MGTAGSAGFNSLATMSVFCPTRVGVMGKALHSQWICIQCLLNVRGNIEFTFALKHGAHVLKNIPPHSEFSQQAPKNLELSYPIAYIRCRWRCGLGLGRVLWSQRAKAVLWVSPRVFHLGNMSPGALNAANCPLSVERQDGH